MTTSLKDIDFSQYSLTERAILNHDLQESIRAEADAAPVPPEYMAELRRRLAEMEAGTAELVTWDDIEASVFGRD